ncbi:hypothetical protein [Neoroseomonas soli]|uniref:Uncharacterized protein n=1 Tax=Neoroseomonas soli TaxID=1081025 RepID=A0A9X9X0Z4_9PROT|nr:hypothetical protein [Neoroseomonas soli]MBR0673073.1 hypothetical protein [Neoroseomonas soli]
MPGPAADLTVYISRNGNFSGLDYAPVSGTNPKTDHVNDDRHAPVTASVANLY